VGTVLAAFLVGMALWIGQRDGGPATVYAAAVQQVRAAQTAEFSVTVEAAGEPRETVRCTFMAPARMGCEGKGVTAVVDFQEKQMLVSDPHTQTFTVFRLQGMPPVDNFIERIRDLPERFAEVELLGKQTVDGRPAMAFRILREGVAATIWADPGTEKLVRAEFSMGETKVTMSDFAFDVPVAGKLLSLTPPEGYARREQQLNVADVLASLQVPAAPAEHDQLPAGVLQLSPSASLAQGVFVKGGRYSGKRMDVLNLIQTAYGFSPSRIVVNAALPEGLYDVFLQMPEGGESRLFDELRRALRKRLRSEFGIVGREERRDVEVYVLTAPHGQPEALREPVSTNQASVKGGRFRNMGIVGLTGTLEGELKRPVLNETGLDGRYDYEFKASRADSESLQEAVREQVGLELAPAHRTLKMLVIEGVAATE